MSNKKTIDKFRENILEGRKNFVGTKPLYCDIQDDCKILSDAVTQYKKVVEQNQSLQKQILWQKEQMEKDNQYIVKLEEANMLLLQQVEQNDVRTTNLIYPLEQDVEILKRQVETLKTELLKK